jgi:hypothetical protein
MRLSSKILAAWLAFMWIVFSAWVVVVTQFPLNFGFVGLQSMAGIVLMWTMHWYKEV